MAERSPLHGRSIVEVLATSAGGRRHARPLARARRPRRRRHRPGLRRARDRGALRLHARPAPTSARSASRPGWRPLADSRAVLAAAPGRSPAPTWSTPTACAPASSPRPPAGCRASGPGRSSSPCTTHPRGAPAPLQRAAAGGRADDRSAAPTSCSPSPATSPPTPAGRRPRRPGRPGPGPAAAPGDPLAAPRCARSWAWTTGRPLVVAVGRLHPQKGYDVLLDAVARWEADGRLDPAPLVAIAGDGPLEAELAERIRGRAAAGAAARPARATSPTCSAPPTCACCRRAGRAARSPPRRRCAPAPRWSPPAPAACPSCSATAPSLVPVGDAGALADAVVRVLTDPAHAAELAEAGPAAGGELAGRGGRRAPARRRLPRAARRTRSRSP